jgi:hypothetical protein
MKSEIVRTLHDERPDLRIGALNFVVQVRSVAVNPNPARKSQAIAIGAPDRQTLTPCYACDME